MIARQDYQKRHRKLLQADKVEIQKKHDTKQLYISLQTDKDKTKAKQAAEQHHLKPIVESSIELETRENLELYEYVKYLHNKPHQLKLEAISEMLKDPRISDRLQEFIRNLGKLSDNSLDKFITHFLNEKPGGDQADEFLKLYLEREEYGNKRIKSTYVYKHDKPKVTTITDLSKLPIYQQYKEQQQKSARTFAEIQEEHLKFQKLGKVDRCDISIYKTAPWLDAREIVGVYISPVDQGENIDMYKLGGITSVTDLTLIENNTTWYRVNNEFLKLLCGFTAKRVNQTEDVLTIYNLDDEVVLRVRMAYYTRDKGLIVQDEGLFQAEKEYRSDMTKKITRTVSEIKDSYKDEKLSAEILDIGAEFLSRNLQYIAPSKTEYDTNSFFVSRIIELISVQSIDVSDFADRLAEIVAYFNIKFGANTFDAKISNLYYTPDIFIELTPADKFPEIFDNPVEVTQAQQNNVLTHINFRKKQAVNEFINMIYEYRNRTGNKKPVNYSVYEPKLNINEWDIKVCVNKEEAAHIPPEDVVYYREKISNNIYCLSIDSILNGDIYNPYSGLKNDELDKDFVAKVHRLYGHKLAKATPLEGTDDEEEEEEIIYAPGLLDIITKNIEAYEVSTFKVSSSALKHGGKNKKIEVKGEEGGEIYNAKCSNCNEITNNTDIKTVSGTGKPIYFCGFECFEMYKKFIHKK